MKNKTGVFLLALSFLSFVSLGLPDGVFGVAWPSIRASFQLPLDALGPLLLMFTIGFLFSSFSSGAVLARMNVGALLAWSCFATAASLFGYAATPWWWLMIACSTLAGLGAGAIDAGLNTYAATHFSAAAVNWLHAFYGIGATLGPLIMTTVLAAHAPWQTGYAIIGGAQLLLAACFALTHRSWSNGHSTGLAQHYASAPRTKPASQIATLQLPVAWLSIAVFFIYTGVEATAGAWAFSLLTEGRGMSTITAGTMIGVYWGCLTLGRLLSGFVVKRIAMNLLLRICMTAIACGAIMLWTNRASWLSCSGLALIGLAAAPIFPSLIASTPERLGAAHTANAVGFQIAAAMLGASLLPSFAGVLAKRLSLEIVPPALLVAALLLFVFYERLRAKSLQPQQLPTGEFEVAM